MSVSESLEHRSHRSKADFYAHVSAQLLSLLEGSKYWASRAFCPNARANDRYLTSPKPRRCYITPSLLRRCMVFTQTPRCRSSTGSVRPPSSLGQRLTAGFYHYPLPLPFDVSSHKLTLGPFNGRPACVSITPKAGKGVCADAFISQKGVVVTDVEEYPGHIGELLLMIHVGYQLGASPHTAVRVKGTTDCSLRRGHEIGNRHSPHRLHPRRTTYYRRIRPRLDGALDIRRRRLARADSDSRHRRCWERLVIALPPG